MICTDASTMTSRNMTITTLCCLVADGAVASSQAPLLVEDLRQFPRRLPSRAACRELQNNPTPELPLQSASSAARIDDRGSPSCRPSKCLEVSWCCWRCPMLFLASCSDRSAISFGFPALVKLKLRLLCCRLNDGDDV